MSPPAQTDRGGNRDALLQRRRIARRKGRARLAVLVATLLAAVLVPLLVGSSGAAGPPAPRSRATSSGRGVGASSRAPAGGRHRGGSLPFPSPPGRGMRPGPNLAPGSNPSVLPGDVLIADEGNNRIIVVNPAGTIVWQFPRPGDLAPGTTFLEPDDAFFTPNGKDILATEENDQVVSLVGLRSHRLLWRYGTPGVRGSGPNQLSNPDDAMMLPNGDALIADIMNCSLLIVRGGTHVPAERIGIQDTYCLHQPPLRFGSPNGAFPLTNGNYLVTEINGDWADEITLQGKVLWSTHPPGVAYPSDTNEVSPGRYLTVDYSNPGQIVEFNKQGKLLWRYGPASGPGKLTTPSLCEPIPTNGDVLCNDDGNDRVIVVDPRTDKIVWQYGHDGIAGSAPGYLSGPDGVDLAPPYSLLVRHGPTMGLPLFRCAPGLPSGACTVFPPG